MSVVTYVCIFCIFTTATTTTHPTPILPRPQNYPAHVSTLASLYVRAGNAKAALAAFDRAALAAASATSEGGESLPLGARVKVLQVRFSVGLVLMLVAVGCVCGGWGLIFSFLLT